METSKTAILKTSLSKHPTSPHIPLPHISNTTDISFSSYIRPPQDKETIVEDSEISIFDAQKYFNECNSGNTNDPRQHNRVSPVTNNVGGSNNNIATTSVHRFSSASSSVDGYYRNYRVNSFHRATPTASSEASWNSQTGLLANPPGAIAVSVMDNNILREQNMKGSAGKWFFKRRCPCSGKKSVQVEEKVSSEPKTPSLLNHNVTKVDVERKIHTSIGSSTMRISSSGNADWLEKREPVIPSISHRISAENKFFTSVKTISTDSATNNGFTFPILNQTPSTTTKQSSNIGFASPARDSIEVFQPKNHSLISPKSTTIAATELISRRQSFTFHEEDDMASDASSDLFEIESFSTQTTSYPMYNNSSKTGVSVEEPSEYCYEPSEASIDWSVTTAEGFERMSVTNLSEITDRSAAFVSEKTPWGGDGKKRGGNGGGLLLSCRCEKAVNIGPIPVKCVSNEGQRVVSSTMKHVSCSSNSRSNKPRVAKIIA